MLGKAIVLSNAQMGRHLEAIAGEAGIKPGHIVRIKPGVALNDGGDPTVELWDGAVNGERGILMVVDIGWEGDTYEKTYDAGDRLRLYIPLPGNELNVRVKAGETITVGLALIKEADSGLVIATTGTPESEPLQALEAGAGDGSPMHVIVTGA